MSSDPEQQPQSVTDKSQSPPTRLHLPKLQPPTFSVASPLASPRQEFKLPSAASSPSVSHRSSYIEGSHVRGIPPSPRAQRAPSFTQHGQQAQQALQELFNNPPVARNSPEEERFTGRDWRSVKVGEIIAPEEVRFVQVDTSVEEATKVGNSLDLP